MGRILPVEIIARYIGWDAWNITSKAEGFIGVGEKEFTSGCTSQLQQVLVKEMVVGTRVEMRLPFETRMEPWRCDHPRCVDLKVGSLGAQRTLSIAPPSKALMLYLMSDCSQVSLSPRPQILGRSGLFNSQHCA